MVYLTNTKSFADDTSQFFVVYDITASSFLYLKSELNWVKEWLFQFNFNPDPSKRAQKDIFARKLQKLD